MPEKVVISLLLSWIQSLLARGNYRDNWRFFSLTFHSTKEMNGAFFMGKFMCNNLSPLILLMKMHNFTDRGKNMQKSLKTRYFDTRKWTEKFWPYLFLLFLNYLLQLVARLWNYLVGNFVFCSSAGRNW